MFRLILGISLSAVVGYSAYRRGSLSKSGVMGLLLSGAILFYFGGWVWFAMLLAFLISASLWTLYQHNRKKFLDDIAAKTGPRDLVQALANVGVACVIAVLYRVNAEPALFLSFLGSLAAVNADTWATEIGTLSKTKPRLITTWQQVSPGTSGGLTFLGTLAGMAGSLFIGLLGMGFQWLDSQATGQAFAYDPFKDTLIVLFSGCLGLMLDSLLGATLQARYFCNICQKMTEQQLHRGMHRTQYQAGIRWFTNDWVNFASSLVAAIVAFFLTQI